MTKLLYIIDNHNFLFSETAYTQPELDGLFAQNALKLPVRAEILQCLHLEGLSILALRSLESPLAVLTGQQFNVLELLAKGKTVSQISLILKISNSTVRFHLNNAKEKLRVETRNELLSCFSRYHSPPLRKQILRKSNKQDQTNSE